MTSRSYLFEVKMPCGGCSGAITRVLTKQKEKEQVSDFTVSLKKQLVLVESSALDFAAVKEILTKTQKEILKEKEVLAGWKIPEAEEEKVEWEAVPAPLA